jgi:hypothetical protein
MKVNLVDRCKPPKILSQLFGPEDFQNLFPFRSPFAAST